MGTYIHHVPGRLRVKMTLPGMEGSKDLMSAINGLAGVIESSVNPRSRSLIVRYDPDVVAPETILDRVRAAGGIDFARPRSAKSGIATMVGAAAGQAIFGAFLRTGLEKSLAGLVAATIR